MPRILKQNQPSLTTNILHPAHQFQSRIIRNQTKQQPHQPQRPDRPLQLAHTTNRRKQGSQPKKIRPFQSTIKPRRKAYPQCQTNQPNTTRNRPNTLHQKATKRHPTTRKPHPNSNQKNKKIRNLLRQYPKLSHSQTATQQ